MPSLLLMLGVCGFIFIKDTNTMGQETHRSINDDLRDIEQEIHRRVNTHRKNKHGLPTLQFSQTIRQACLRHSKRMAMGKVAFGHDGFDERIDKIGEVIKLRSASENVSSSMGYDRSKVAEIAVKGWIKSTGHHKNMIGDYALTGVGVYQNKKGRYYCTQIFINLNNSQQTTK